VSKNNLENAFDKISNLEADLTKHREARAIFEEKRKSDILSERLGPGK